MPTRNRRPLILVIHGAGGGFDQGLEFARPLVDAGFQVIAPSRFGYLRTPLPQDASPMAQADAHASLLDALQLEKVAVVGRFRRGAFCHAALPAAPRSGVRRWCWSFLWSIAAALPERRLPH